MDFSKNLLFSVNFYLATFNEHDEIVDLLLMHKSDINSRENSGNTALHIGSLLKFNKFYSIFYKF